MGAVYRQIAAKTGRTASANSTLFTVGDYRSVTIFLDATATVSGTGKIQILHSDDLTDATTVTSFNLGAALTIGTGAAVKYAWSFSNYSSLGFGRTLWANWSLSSGATATFGLGAIFRD